MTALCSNISFKSTPIWGIKAVSSDAYRFLYVLKTNDMTLVLVIFVILVFALLAWVILKMGELDELQEQLDKYSVHLDERANRLAADEQTTIELNRQLKAELKRLEGKK